MNNSIKSLAVGGITLVLCLGSQARADTAFGSMPQPAPFTEQPMFKQAMEGLRHNQIQKAQEESKVMAERSRITAFAVMALVAGFRAAVKRKA